MLMWVELVVVAAVVVPEIEPPWSLVQAVWVARQVEAAVEAAARLRLKYPPEQVAQGELVPQVRFASGPGRKNQCRQNVGIGAANEAI